MTKDKLIVDLRFIRTAMVGFLHGNRAANEAAGLPLVGPAALEIGLELRELLQAYEEIVQQPESPLPRRPPSRFEREDPV